MFLAGGVFVGSVSSMAVLTGIIDHAYNDLREISLFVDHIRFSILIDMAIFSLMYMAFDRSMAPLRWERILYAIVICWLVIFLFILQAITGIIIFLGVGFILFWVYLPKVPTLVLRWTLAVFMIAAALIGFSLLTRSVGRFYNVEEVDPDNIDQATVNGNPYSHDFSRRFIENGHYTWLYLCETELRREWNKVSKLDYDGRDLNGNRIRHTLIRYLTSKGLRKDSVGLVQLSGEDIRLIESGKTNYLQGRKFSLYNKLYEVLWQIDVFRKN